MRKLSKSRDVDFFISVTKLFLNISNPVIIKFWVRRVPGWEDCQGVCLSYNDKHKISLCVESCDTSNPRRLGVFELLAHELTHAHVSENHPRATFHGRTFQRKVAALRRALRGLGYNLGPLYRPGIDV